MEYPVVVGDDMLQPGVDPLTPVSQPAQLGQAALQALLGAGGLPGGEAPRVQLGGVGGQQAPAAGARAAVDGGGAGAKVAAGAGAGAVAGTEASVGGGEGGGLLEP